MAHPPNHVARHDASQNHPLIGHVHECVASAQINAPEAYAVQIGWRETLYQPCYGFSNRLCCLFVSVKAETKIDRACHAHFMHADM